MVKVVYYFFFYIGRQNTHSQDISRGTRPGAITSPDRISWGPCCDQYTVQLHVQHFFFFFFPLMPDLQSVLAEMKDGADWRSSEWLLVFIASSSSFFFCFPPPCQLPLIHFYFIFFLRASPLMHTPSLLLTAELQGRSIYRALCYALSLQHVV